MGDTTAEQLETLVNDNPEDTSIHGAMMDAMEEHGVEFGEDGLENKPETNDEPAAEAVEVQEKKPADEAEAKEAKPEDADEESVPDSEVDDNPPKEEGQEKPDQQAKDTDEQDAPGSLTPPGSWSAEERDEFTNLPEKAQAAILRREGDRDRAFSQKQAELSQKAQRYSAIDQVIEPYKDNFAMHGIDPANLFGQYLAIDKAMSSDPMGTIQMLAGRAGVDLSSLNPEAAEEESPQIAALNAKIQELGTQVSGFQTNQQQESVLQKQQREAELQGQIDAFATSTDESGNLKYPHFEELRPAMSALVSSGQSQDLDAAYTQALWGSANHRESLLATQRRDQERKVTQEKKTHAKKAAKAGSSIAGSPGGAEPPAPVGSVGEELAKAFAASE